MWGARVCGVEGKGVWCGGQGGCGVEGKGVWCGGQEGLVWGRTPLPDYDQDHTPIVYSRTRQRFPLLQYEPGVVRSGHANMEIMLFGDSILSHSRDPS